MNNETTWANQDDKNLDHDYPDMSVKEEKAQDALDNYEQALKDARIHSMATDIVGGHDPELLVDLASNSEEVQKALAYIALFDCPDRFQEVTDVHGLAEAAFNLNRALFDEALIYAEEQV
jgi:hypothetical protein